MRAIAISIITLSIASASVAAAATSGPTPAELLEAAPAPSGFELASDELRSQGFDDFARSSPYSVGHVQIGSAEADGLEAGQDVWGLGTDETLLREVVRWSSADVAGLYQEEVAIYASGDALTEIEAPFEGAQAFSGSDPVSGAWVRIVVWTDGSYGAAVSHFANGGDPSDEVVNAAADALARELASASELAETADDDPVDGSSGGGIPLTTVLLFVVIVGGAIWLFLRMRKRLAATRGGGGRSDRGAGDAPPTEAPDPASSSTDDIVERARRKAREEVDRTSEQWQMPDDY